ncbi:hypothetical protein [Fluviispira vulneris]|uniref:hypothetical protein n=1 Tax=Fluviispira vulneris TaxID=2763012 RepID=UPI001645FA13|nr:hypothetical protein [Fluviispira vulneris]
MLHFKNFDLPQKKMFKEFLLRKNYFKEEVFAYNEADLSPIYDRDLFVNRLYNLKKKNILNSLQKDAEQEYIINNMVKGALQEAYYIARQFRLSIVIRPTVCSAFWANEVGHPTKPREIKNKTCKYEDTLLNPKILPKDIGAVVHYKPFEDDRINFGIKINSLAEFKKSFLPLKEEIWENTLKKNKTKAFY